MIFKYEKNINSKSNRDDDDIRLKLTKIKTWTPCERDNEKYILLYRYFVNKFSSKFDYYLIFHKLISILYIFNIFH